MTSNNLMKSIKTRQDLKIMTKKTSNPKQWSNHHKTLKINAQINGWPIRTVSGHTRSVTLFWLKKYKTLSLWGPGWLKELGSCITLELVQTYHQYAIFQLYHGDHF
jgi:hypothetical protein